MLNSIEEQQQRQDSSSSSHAMPIAMHVYITVMMLPEHRATTAAASWAPEQ